jgi:hypothetical protein
MTVPRLNGPAEPSRKKSCSFDYFRVRCQGRKKPQEQRLKEKFKSNFQVRNKTRLYDSKTIMLRCANMNMKKT